MPGSVSDKVGEYYFTIIEKECGMAIRPDDVFMVVPRDEDGFPELDQYEALLLWRDNAGKLVVEAFTTRQEAAFYAKLYSSPCGRLN